MSLVVLAVTPSSRPPDLGPWTGARIQEATAETGPWTTIETLTFTDPDPDPALPKQRTLETQHATVTAGWYRAVFLDAQANTENTAPVAWPLHNWQPAIADVAALLHARTVSGGVELGTFDTTTRPTAAQVTELITAAAADLRARAGGSIPTDALEDARRLTALQAASLIEASFFPDQLDTDRSAYRQYQAMYLNGVEALVNQLEGNTPNRARVASVPMMSGTRAGIGCGLLDPFHTELLP